MVSVHSDQGSQYLSADVRDLVNEAAVQSMSRRGNSLNNAPQESFFGRMKNRIASHFPLMKNIEQVSKMIDAYMNDYNEEVPQESLGGLTPALYYTCRMTGVFPAKEYFGTDARQLNDLRSVIAWLRHQTEKAREKRNRQARTIREKYSAGRRDPEVVILRDIRNLEKKLKSTEKFVQKLQGQLDKIRQVLEGAREVLEYVKNCSAERIEELSSGTGWDQIPELGYVKEYAAVFQ